jgi:hypothetical protein
MLVTALEELAVALGAVLGGAILLLLLGTQILAWPWLVLLGGSGAAIALLRIRHARISGYRVAQIVDRQLGLSDLLSTAWFLLKGAPQSNVSHFAAAQIQTAESAVARVTARVIFPLRWKRSWSITCALAAIALALFATRYLILRKLDLRYSLVPIPAISARAALERVENFIKPRIDQKNRGTELAEAARPPSQGSQESTEPGQSPGSPPASKPGNSTHQSTDAHNAGKSGGQQTPGADAEQQNPASGSPGDKNPRNAPQRAETAPQASGAREQKSEASLSERMRDALSGLLEKMRPETAPQEQSRQASRKQSSRDAGEGQSAEINKNAQQSASGERQDGAAGVNRPQAAEKSALAQTQAAEGASKKGSDSQSGIGRQDGAKNLREAEQLRAMGKLEEIIGKRSATLTGELTVETRSSEQQLQTQYSGRVGHHSDSGGLIQRDEVPLALQNYVREYMEQVHRAANEKR